MYKRQVYDNAAHIEAEDILNALSASIAPADYETPATAFLDHLSQLFGDGSARIAAGALAASALSAGAQGMPVHPPKLIAGEVPTCTRSVYEASRRCPPRASTR